MLMPKRVKYRRVQRGRMKGKATRGNVVTYGEFGLQAQEPCWITSNQIAAERIAKTVTRATVIDVVIALDRWLVQRAEVDERLSPEMLESITGFHRKYIEYITSNET